MDVFFTHQTWLLCVLEYPSGLVLALVGTHWSLLATILGCSIVFVTVFLYMMQHVLSVCQGTWPVLYTVIDLGHGQSCALCVSSCTCPVMSTQCLLISGQSCAQSVLVHTFSLFSLCVFMYLPSHVHSVCSCTCSVLCNGVFLYLASLVHCVYSYTWPVLSMLCVPILGQS